MFEKNLKNIRIKCGYSQKYVADYLNISPQSVSKWENGDALPSILFLPKLAECFGCDINDFFAVANVPNYDLEMLESFFKLMKIHYQEKVEYESFKPILSIYSNIVDELERLFNDLEKFKTIKFEAVDRILNCSRDESNSIIKYMIELEIFEKIDVDDLYFVNTTNLCVVIESIKNIIKILELKEKLGY